MKTFLAVTLFFRILTFEFAIAGGADDVDNDITKCNVVTPMSGFDSNKYFENLKHMYATHARYGGRLGVCLELHTNKYSNGTISYNYGFNGNGIPENGIKGYTGNCTGTEDSKQDGQFSFDCIQKYDLDLEVVKKDLLKKRYSEAEVKRVIKKMTEGGNKDEFTLKVTVLSTDYEKYTLIHRCAEISVEGIKMFLDNYVVFNKEENAGLPTGAKTKFTEYNWQEGKFATRTLCKNENKKTV